MIRQDTDTAAAQPAPTQSGISRRDAEAGFTLELPPGWSPDTAESLDAINTRAAELGGPGVARYSAAFRPQNDVSTWTAWLSTGDADPGSLIAELPADVIPPFVLVQTLPIETAGLGREAIGAWVTKDLGEEAGDTPPTFDPDSMTVVARSTQTVPAPAGSDAEPITMIATTRGYVGRDHVVYMHAYADERMAPMVEPVFGRIGESFRFDEGRDFVEQPSTTAVPGTGGGGGANALPLGILIPVFGGLIVLVGVVIVVRNFRARGG